MYQLTESTIIKRIADGALIPADGDNIDYAQYLNWRLEGGTPEPYVPPDDPIPQVVSWRQANLALLETPSGDGNLLDAVEALIKAIADPAEKRKAQIEFNSPTYERESAFLLSMWAALGGTEAQLDDLFILAGTK